MTGGAGIPACPPEDRSGDLSLLKQFRYRTLPAPADFGLRRAVHVSHHIALLKSLLRNV